jgi:hypothetical protein
MGEGHCAELCPVCACLAQGENIKRVYEATGVSKIDVNDGIIRIVGPSNAAVLHAREMLELLQVPHQNI